MRGELPQDRLRRLVAVQRFIRVRDKRIETTHCAWCTDDAVCSACHAKAEQVRADATDTKKGRQHR